MATRLPLGSGWCATSWATSNISSRLSTWITPACRNIASTAAWGATIVRTHAHLTEIGAGARVGPFVFLRPGSSVDASATVAPFTDLGAARGDAAASSITTDPEA